MNGIKTAWNWDYNFRKSILYICMYVCVCHHEDHHGLLEDCEITLIYKTDSSDPTRREFFWMYELKNLAPLGLNICEIV